MIETIGTLAPQIAEQTLDDGMTGLEFYDYILAYLEVLSCTFYVTEPKFAVYLTQNFAAKDTLQRISRVTGLESWVIVSLWQITMLRRWKEDQIAKGALSMAELVRRASFIEQDLQQRRQEMIAKSNHTDSDAKSHNNNTIPKSSDSGNGQPSPAVFRERAAFTNVFAAAAAAFLHATVSEPRPQIPEISQAIADTIQALRLLPRPDLLRRLAWPICVAACLADLNQQAFFDGLAHRVTEAYGREENVTRGLVVARECWRLRSRASTGSGGGAGASGGGGAEDRTYDWRDGMRNLGVTLLLF